MAANLRYMSLDRRQDLLSCHFAFIAEQKSQNLVQHLLAAFKKTEALKRKLPF